MLRRAIAIGTVVAVVALSGTSPLLAADKEHRQMMADIRMLQEQNQQLQLQLAILLDALRNVTTKLDEQAGANRKAFADQRLIVDTVGTDLRVVREKVDETNVRLTSLSQEVEALRAAGASASPPPAAAGATDTSSPAGTASTPVQLVAPSNPGVSPQRLFESARADYYAGQWTLAIQGFETYMKTFPKSDVADDAQYYIGETYYSAGKFKEAVSAYDRVIANYPTSNTLPDAYYKRGLALNSLGQVQQARESFEYVTKTFPDSDAGRLARQALDRLNRIGR
jgi:tol-pal system protein YbgF